jgi:hypothetical protein
MAKIGTIALKKDEKIAFCVISIWIKKYHLKIDGLKVSDEY